MNRKKIAGIIGAVVIIAALGGAGFYFRDQIMQAVPAFSDGKSDDKVYVEKVSKLMNQNTGISNRYNGVVETQDTYEVNVDSSRTIKEIYVKVGDEVEEGQKLLDYDTSDINMQIQQANLEVESINNDIANYNTQIKTLADEREKAAESEKFSYTTEIQSLENNIAQSKFDLESKQLEISKYRKQMENSSVTSKAAGIVKELNENGMDANGNSAPFMRILQKGDYRVKGTIDEQNVWMLQEGQQVVIRSRVDAEKTWSGSIGKIDTENAVKNENGGMYMSSDGQQETATKYPFYIELASAEELMLGQHVYIEMDEGQEEKKEGIWLMSGYIIQNEGDKPFVWAATDKERLEKRVVELGEYDQAMDMYQIVSGLTEKDYVAWPMPGLYEGVKTVTNADEVDYSSPLYNQESTEAMPGMEDPGMEGGMEMIPGGSEMEGMGGFESGTENSFMPGGEAEAGSVEVVR